MELTEIEPNGHKENIKQRKRRMYPRNLIKTKEELEMMNHGLIEDNNIPITDDKDIMNSRNYRRRIEVISEIIYHKAVAYHLERTRGKWETTRVAIYGKISMRSLFIDGPVTPCVNEPYGTIIQRKLEISFAANEEITARKIMTRIYLKRHMFIDICCQEAS